MRTHRCSDRLSEGVSVQRGDYCPGSSLSSGVSLQSSRGDIPYEQTDDSENIIFLWDR